MKDSFIVFIPARYGSTRFPGKPLAKIQGTEMVLHVVRKAESVCHAVYVLTDDVRIAEVVRSHNSRVILTGTEHTTGTSRCAEAVKKIPQPVDPETVIINLQGDEPLIQESVITDLVEAFADTSVQVATFIHRLKNTEDITNPNRVKVVVDSKSDALYFSRSAIPYAQQNNKKLTGFQHIGIYGFRMNILQEIAQLRPTPLEEAEALEQLRWLESGYKIRCIETNYCGFGIDTPEDLIKAEIQLGKI